MKSNMLLKVMGTALFLAAVGIVLFRTGGPAKRARIQASLSENASNDRTRDKVQGTPSERMERLRGVLFGKKNKDLNDEDFRLMRSLSPEALRQLLDEFAAAPASDSEQSVMVIEMLKYLGGLEKSATLEWVMTRESGWIWKIPRDFVIHQVITGWAERDAMGALDKVLDPAVRDLGAQHGSDSFNAISKAPAELVMKATAEDPEGTWRVMCQNHRMELGSQFFTALDPAAAKGYAMRLQELFRDPDKPGLEVFGGLETDPSHTDNADRYLAAAKEAACGWMVREPEAALAWYLKQSPALDNSESGIGQKAGTLMGRWVKEEPDKALDWARSKPAGMRVTLADEVASSITELRSYSEEDLSRLKEAFAWMDASRRTQWLIQTAKSQRWHAAYRGVMRSPAEQIMAGLPLTGDETAALERVLDAEAGE